MKTLPWLIWKYFSDILKVYFPLENEPLPPDEIQTIINRKREDDDFWAKHKKKTVTGEVKVDQWIKPGTSSYLIKRL